MPFQARPVSDERDALAVYIAQQQDAFRSVIHGLTDEEAGRAPTPSALCVGSVVKHVAWVQTGWLEQALAAPDPVPPRGPETYAEHQENWTWRPDDTVAGVLARLDEGSERVLQAVRTLDLDLPVPVPPAPWNPTDIPAWSVRWVWLHLIEELARHAGHADIIREAVDGATMYELVAAREGFPETPWLKPWRRAET
jgi:Protein of unknown function (DUF664)